MVRHSLRGRRFESCRRLPSFFLFFCFWMRAMWLTHSEYNFGVRWLTLDEVWTEVSQPLIRQGWRHTILRETLCSVFFRQYYHLLLSLTLPPTHIYMHVELKTQGVWTSRILSAFPDGAKWDSLLLLAKGRTYPLQPLESIEHQSSIANNFIEIFF